MLHNFFKQVLLVTTMLLLGGCASTQDSINAPQLSEIKKIGIVSLVGNQLHREYIGLTAFNNESESLDISTWNIDKEYETQLQNELTKIGHFLISQVSQDKVKEFDSVYNLNGPWDAPAFHTPNWGAIEEKLRSFAHEHSFDSLILVVASPTNNNGGLGLHGAFRTDAALRLSAVVAIIDGKTGKPIAIRPLARIQEGLPGTIARSEPSAYISDGTVRSKLSSLDEAIMERIHAKIIDLPKNQWQPTLRALFGMQAN
jgi:hypothetical protein